MSLFGLRLLPSILSFVGACAAAVHAADPGPISNETLGNRLRQMTNASPDLVRIQPLVQTPAGNAVWVVEIGTGNDAQRRRNPALLAVAGLEGNDLLGTASLLRWIEHLQAATATNEDSRLLLEKTTIYVVPSLNPDAAAAFFKAPRIEQGNDFTPVDDDRDGDVNEDGSEDLNGDGLVTLMRVRDSEGEYIQDPAEPRLMIKADRARGESGLWRLLTEGRDNDQDESWNEDSPGGVNFNRNYPFNFKFFAPDSGPHPVSQTVTRALADFVINRPHIAVVFAFSAADNLTQPPKSEAPKRPPTAVHEDDIAWFREAGKLWRETLGLGKEIPGASELGTFADWMYFHRGRWALQARAWTPALQLEAAKSKDSKPTKPETAPKENGGEANGNTNATPSTVPGAKPENAQQKKNEKGGDAESRNTEERAFLKWIEQQSPSAFIPWKPIEHPDFPGKQVEVGGYAPYARVIPPTPLWEGWTEKHARFLTALAGKLPRIGIRKVSAKHLGESLFEVVVQVENTGYLPTVLAQGTATREVDPTRVVLDVPAEALVIGKKTEMLEPIPGSGGAKEVRYVINGKKCKTVTVDVISALAGSVREQIEMKEGTR